MICVAQSIVPPVPHASPSKKPGRRPRLDAAGYARTARLVVYGILGSMTSATAVMAQGLPTGGSVAAGTAGIATTASTVTVRQSSQSAVINWQSFNIAAGHSVNFVQPTASSVVLNRVVGPDPSAILGNLSANGKVFLVNPNGVLFGQSAQVNVGGLVASTLDIADADFMAGNYRFAGAVGGAVLNKGTIRADGGYVALLGASVSNEGTIQARLGSVILAAGKAMTLDVVGDGLLSVAIDTGAVNALVSNGGLIRADGGSVVLTAQAAGQLLQTAVNNSGIIEARTLEGRGGSIMLLADMQSGTTNVGGTLDASATSGDGGFIETSAAHVNVADAATITTAASAGLTGTWLIDPQDFTIAAVGGNISGATLSALLVANSVSITTSTGSDATVAGTPPVTTLNTAVIGNGDIFVNDAVAWVAAPSTTTLTLTAARDINVNAPISATNGNVVLCCGRDANINAAITTVRGSVLVGTGRNINLSALAAMTTTDGNITLCAGLDITIAGAITLTRGSTIPAQSLGLPVGLVFISGTSGSGPGVAGGTVIFAPLAPRAAVTGPNAPVTLIYNPISYAAPTDYSGDFTLTNGSVLAQRMLVFPNANKVFDGTTNATLAGFNASATSGLPSGVVLVAGPGASAVFDDPAVSASTGVTFSGYTLAGANAAQYSLAGGTCCVATFRTTGVISSGSSVTPPVVTPPVVVTTPDAGTPVTIPVVATQPTDASPVVSTPVVTAPGIVAPIVVPVVITQPNGTLPVATTPGALLPAPTSQLVGGNIVTPVAGTLVNESAGAPGLPIAAAGFQLAMLGGGVRMPIESVAQPIPIVARPVAALPIPTPVRPTPRYAPKQDRH
jgi:filamentous hemagglutinin family protein